jgi:hypothetical protein
MLSVAANTEKIEKSITYSGMLSDLNVQTEILAWKLFDLEAPSAVLMKVKMDYSNVGGKGMRGFIKGIPYWMIWGSLGLLAAGGGVAIAMAADGGSNGSPIGEPPNFPSAP